MASLLGHDLDKVPCELLLQATDLVAVGRYLEAADLVEPHAPRAAQAFREAARASTAAAAPPAPAMPEAAEPSDLQSTRRAWRRAVADLDQARRERDAAVQLGTRLRAELVALRGEAALEPLGFNATLQLYEARGHLAAGFDEARPAAERLKALHLARARLTFVRDFASAIGLDVERKIGELDPPEEDDDQAEHSGGEVDDA